MLSDSESMPDCENWAMLFKRLLCSLGFNNVWLAQGVGNVNIFLVGQSSVLLSMEAFIHL